MIGVEHRSAFRVFNNSTLETATWFFYFFTVIKEGCSVEAKRCNSSYFGKAELRDPRFSATTEAYMWNIFFSASYMLFKQQQTAGSEVLSSCSAEVKRSNLSY